MNLQRQARKKPRITKNKISMSTISQKKQALQDADNELPNTRHLYNNAACYMVA